MDDNNRDFRERFDTLATHIGLAIVALGAAVWIEATMRRLYY